jgi:hypothetical protein
MALYETGRPIGRRRGWQLRRFSRDEEMLTVLRPYAATGVETCGVVWSDRSTVRQFNEKSVSLATVHWRCGCRVFAVSALDHG